MLSSRPRLRSDSLQERLKMRFRAKTASGFDHAFVEKRPTFGSKNFFPLDLVPGPFQAARKTSLLSK